MAFGKALPAQDERSLRRMWMQGRRSIFNYYAPRDKYGHPYEVLGGLDVRWHLRYRVRANHYLHRYVTLRSDLWERSRKLVTALGLSRDIEGTVQHHHGKAFIPSTKRILGVHMRGSDKRHGKKIPPDVYIALAKAYIREKPNTTIFVATDDPAYLRAFSSHFGARAVFSSSARSSKSFQCIRGQSR